MRESIALIEAERERQITQEGWTPHHDTLHGEGELARCAAIYATPESFREMRHISDGETGLQEIPIGWPFDCCDWKPSPDNRVRELVKAGALIAAEIERLLAEEMR